MAVSTEKFMARQHALTAVDGAKATLLAAMADLEQANDAIAAELQEGDLVVEAPAPIPTLAKINGKLVEGTIPSIHPGAPGA